MADFRTDLRKSFIRLRTNEMRRHRDPGREARENFETFCWAWANDCLAERRDPPVENPYPFAA